MAIAGGGYTGLWTALLAKSAAPGRDVVLLEAGTVAQGASGRNGGFVAASLTHGFSNGLARWPRELAALTALGLRPLVDLDLRLGEGTGALLALPVVQSAARAMREVATFDAAGVTDKN